MRSEFDYLSLLLMNNQLVVQYKQPGRGKIKTILSAPW